MSLLPLDVAVTVTLTVILPPSDTGSAAKVGVDNAAATASQELPASRTILLMITPRQRIPAEPSATPSPASRHPTWRHWAIVCPPLKCHPGEAGVHIPEGLCLWAPAFAGVTAEIVASEGAPFLLWTCALRPFRSR